MPRKSECSCGESRVRRLGSRAVLERPFPWILDRQRRGDHDHLAHAAVRVGGEHHPGQPRVERESGDLASDVGESRSAFGVLWLRRIRAPSSLEQCDAVADLAARRAGR